jgi:hypothetical protein
MNENTKKSERKERKRKEYLLTVDDVHTLAIADLLEHADVSRTEPPFLEVLLRLIFVHVVAFVCIIDSM